MPRDSKTLVKGLLRRVEAGDSEAEAELLELLYDELHGRARKLMRGQARQVTLQATVLVHEAYMRLLGSGAGVWRDRAHFLATASRAMRQALIDHARRRKRRKRSAWGKQEALDQIVISFETQATDLLELDDAIEALARFNPDMARAVELCFFGGASPKEAAGILGLSKRTFERRWAAARAWLYAELS